MKQKLLYITLMILCALAWSGEAWGDNHVPFTITESNWREFATGSNLSWGRTLKKVEWFKQYYTQYGLLINNGSNLTNWNDKVVTVTFTGIADVLSFDYEAQEGTTKREWFVKEPSENGWRTLWSCTDNNDAFEGSQSIQLSPTTTQVQLIWSGNIGGVFSNVHVSELIYLRTETESIDFGTHYLYDGEIQKTFKVKHCNMKSGVSVASNVGSVTVGNNLVPGTGQDILDESTITVTYKNNSVGSIGSGKKISLDDLSNAVNDISIPITATTLDRYMNVNTTLLSFGENMKGEAKTQTFEISHLNLKDGIEISSTNPNFTVSSSSIATSLTTGNDATKTNITVTYSNSSVGTNNGVITIHDKSGKITDKTISVSGTTKTTYYTKAEATASAGGNVYASFTDGTFISSSAITNSEATNFANASTTAYFKAENASGYNFKGWTLPNQSYTDGYLSEKGATFNETYTYNSEDSSNPTTITYKAWFAPKATFNVSVGVGTIVGGTASTNWDSSTKTLEGTPGGITVSTSVTYSATVSNTDSYKFCGWAESKTETDDSKITGDITYNVNLQGSAGSTVNKTLYAIYAPKFYYSATPNVGNGGGGTASTDWTSKIISEPNATESEAKPIFMATANPGYVFIGWATSPSAKTAAQCESIENPYQPKLENKNPGSTVGKTLYAIFAPVFNFSATYTKNRDGGTVTAEVASATITGDPGDTSASTTATFRATPTEGSYVFKGWKTAVNDEDYESNENPYTTSGDKNITNSTPGSTATKKLVAIFAPLYNFSATALVGSVKGGTVSVSGYSTQVEGAPDATEGTTTATYTATANDGYKFVGWSDSANGNIVYTDNPHNQTLTNASPGNTERLTLYAIFKLDGLELNPGNPSYTPDNYSSVTLSRTLKAGYSTIALPFDTDVSKLVTGRTEPYNNANDWVAQLDIVTYNAQDGYTLYFQKVDGGTITANQPYVLHLGYEVKDPTWTDTTNGITVATASAASVTPSTGYSGYAGWTMNANYAVGFNMENKYGIVNSEGGLKLGGSGSSLNAFTAYITGPTSGPNGAPRLRVAYVDEDGTATFIGSLPEDDLQGEPVAIYGPDGQRRSKMQRGVNIVRYSDGTTKKVQL